MIASLRKTLFVALAMALSALLANPSQTTASMPASVAQAQQAAADPAQAVFFAVSRQGGDSTNEIYRYTVAGPNEPAILETTITRPNITNPYGLAFSDADELYVSNAYVNPSIARLLDPAGSATAHGAIADASLLNPVGLVIREGLLYVSQVAGNVKVFSLDADGNGTLIGTISANLAGGSPRNVAINPPGDELLVAQCCGGDSIVRYMIDGPGVATFMGVINGNGLNGAHDLVFSPWGELFVANAHGGTISRFTFDPDGNAIPNGVLAGNGISGPLGLDFSPWGELFAADHFSAVVSRWIFGDDAPHTAIPNGFFSTPNTLADLMFFASFTPTAVTVDIKPGSLPNSINPGSRGMMPVAILTTDAFDATSVDPLSVKFGPNDATESHGRGHVEDVDGDGDLDLVLHFRTQDTGIQCGDTSASLTGETFGGQAIGGSDSINTVGCN